MGGSPSVFQCLRFLDCTSVEEVATKQIGRVLANKEFFMRNVQEAVALADASAHSGNGGPRGFLTDLYLTAEKLVNRDNLSKLDTFVVLCQKSKRENIWREIGRTEVIFNSLNPRWMMQIRIMYRFEQVQKLRFSLFNADSKAAKGMGSPQSLDLREQDFMGAAECTLCEIVTADNQAKTLRMELDSKGAKLESSSEYGGSLTVRAERVAMSNAIVETTLACRGLDNKSAVVGNIDPFLVISRLREDDDYTGVYKTEVVENNINPTWVPIRLPLQQLCNGDVRRPLVIQCFDFKADGSHRLLGQATMSVSEMQQVSGTGEGFELVRPRRADSSSTKAAKVVGKLFCLGQKVENQTNFLDYIFGGCKIGLMVAIDFTISNGSPELPASLHYIDPSGKSNPYQNAILSLGRILEYYDTDKRYNAYGFGALVGVGAVSHCFNLNGQSTSAEVTGVNGIIEAYQTALQNVKLAGPTLFAPTIREAIRVASQSESSGESVDGISACGQRQKYHVLLILTDGAINDMQPFLHALKEASEFPISVMIVGVGDADFSRMEALVSDNNKKASSDTTPKRYRCQGRRDIMQFVAMKKMADGDMLARELLGKLPGQVVEFMQMQGIAPNQRTLPQSTNCGGLIER